MPGWKRCEPIFDWSDESVARILAASGVPMWSGYSLGMQRTACWCCPGQRPIAYAAVRRAFPDVFRAYEELETTVGEEAFWTQSLKGRPVTYAADRGDEMLAKPGPSG
jgi:3'-phosphoadenosine 5'-phosphosulfate sulfotransferase (PAPS reductase)/FAD synthetase